MQKAKNKRFGGFKRGAASYYIVAFSTLILVVIATSFATVIISEVSRTENDDLSQSAYDSALAGVEDAKVAFSNYRRCKEAGHTAGTEPLTGSTVSGCSDIIWAIEKMPENLKCSMVGYILGKLKYGDTENMEVTVGGQTVAGSGGETTTNQAYTCVQINTDLNDYRSTLSSKKMVQTIRAQVGTAEMNDVASIRISWYSVRSDVRPKYANFDDENEKIIFPKLGASTIAVPPTIELQIVQTGRTFRLSDFDQAVVSGSDSKTNRATLYLVPTNTRLSTSTDTYIGAYNTSAGTNVITADQVAKTNNKTVANAPFAVFCGPASDEFYCSAEIRLPGAIGTSGSTRNNKTFMLSVAIPYQQPDTDFSIEMICANGSTCASTSGTSIDVTGGVVSKIANTQISIDSTGRANDLYRRVETRLETSDTEFGYGAPYYALQILGNGTTEKNMKVEYEPQAPQGFYF